MHAINRVLFCSLVFILVCSAVFAGTRDACKIGGEKVAVVDIPLSIDFFPEKKIILATAEYTFHLEGRDLAYDMKRIDKYLHSKNSYYRMAGVLLVYINSVFPKTPCATGKAFCSKEIYLSVKNYFEYLNNNKDLKKIYLEASISHSLFTPKYKVVDGFQYARAKEVVDAFYAISYQESDTLLNQTLINKMMLAIMNKGYFPDLKYDRF